MVVVWIYGNDNDNRIDHIIDRIVKLLSNIIFLIDIDILTYPSIFSSFTPL